jgi:hypothetical protein
MRVSVQRLGQPVMQLGRPIPVAHTEQEVDVCLTCDCGQIHLWQADPSSHGHVLECTCGRKYSYDYSIGKLTVSDPSGTTSVFQTYVIFPSPRRSAQLSVLQDMMICQYCERITPVEHMVAKSCCHMCYKLSMIPLEDFMTRRIIQEEAMSKSGRA